MLSAWRHSFTGSTSVHWRFQCSSVILFRADQSYCRKAANRRIKHRLTPNPQPQEIRTLDRIAYIAVVPSRRVRFSHGQKKERPSVLFRSSRPLVGVPPIQWLLRLTPRPSQPPLKLIFACHVFFGSLVWLWEMPAGAASFLPASCRPDTRTHQYNL